jgi:RNA polymerase sigma-70 factor (ECF subfamily)
MASSRRVDENEAAIERLYRSSYRRFVGVLSTITGDYQRGHDAVQETFARALARRSDLRDPASLEAWVWRIGVRTALELRAGRELASLNGSLELAIVEADRDPALAAAIRALPPRRRLMVFLHYFADLPYAAIADVCEVSVGTVAATLAQAREELQAALTEKST